MRTRRFPLGLLAALLVLGVATVAIAEERPPEVDPRAAVQTLGGLLGDAGASWEDTWAAHEAATKALDDASPGEARDAAEEAYESIRRQAVTFLLRRELPPPPDARPVDPSVVRAFAALRKLDDVVPDASVTWREKFGAYKDAKDALDAAEGTYGDVAQAAYAAMRRDVAVALRRDNLPVSGWVLGSLAASILWGGLAVTMTIAMRSGKKASAE